MIEHMTLEQMREFYDLGRYSIIEDADMGYWLRIRKERVPAAFEAGLMPFSCFERYIGADPVYVLPRGTTFVPLLRPTMHPAQVVIVPGRFRQPMPIIGRLTPDRLVQARQCADLVQGNLARRQREEGLENYTGYNEPDSYYVGYKGEFGFLDLLERWSIDRRFEVTTDGYSAPSEFEVPINGVWSKIDVKCGAWVGGCDLRVVAKQHHGKMSKTKSDYYIGARLTADEHQTQLWGWLTHKEVLALPVKTYGENPTLFRFKALTELHDLNDLGLEKKEAPQVSVKGIR